VIVAYAFSATAKKQMAITRARGNDSDLVMFTNFQ
jgi:hypothetical protein